MAKIQVFLDTDVIISALLSKKGASFEIINNPKITKVISETIKEELNEVIQRLDIEKQRDFTKKFKKVKLNIQKAGLIEKYSNFTLDEKDTHVVAGAYKSNSRFLLTHNTKHYKLDEIKRRLDISVMKPGKFLQYLRSKEEN